MNNQITINNINMETIPSYEVASMMDKEHKEVLYMIEGNEKRGIVGIIPTLEQSEDLHLANFFIKSEYNDRGRMLKCYECTKMGCELLATRLNGSKGILFASKYVSKFNQMEQTLMVNSLPVPQGPTLIGQDPCSNYLIRKNINNLDASDIPRYINQVIEQAKDYKPSERLNTYQLTRKALENLLTNPLESYDIAIVRASLDKLNKLIERQKSAIYGGKLGQAKRKQNKLEETIRYYQLDSYDNYYYVDIHGYTVNTAYRAINNEIKCTKSYNDWKDRADEKMQNLPTLKELGLNPNTHKKIDIYFYLKDPTFDVANCQKSFLDALERHYKKECPTFNDNVFADVRTRKYFSYAGDYDMGFIAFGIKDLTQEEIDSLTFDDEE